MSKLAQIYMAKEATPSLVTRSEGDLIYGAMPPIRPLGSPFEIWGGACGIDRSLVVWDVSTLPNGISSPAFRAEELTSRQRKVFARYMVDLWRKFGELESKA